MPQRARVPLVTLLKEVTEAMVAELVERLNAAGYADITVAHHPVFYHLDADGTRLTELAARAGMTHQSMGELVAALVRLGYLTRRPDPHDGRARLVCMTRRGRNAVRRARREIVDIEAGWLDRFHAAGLEDDLRHVLATALRSDWAERPRA
jgi:DNA-binding MarR family transcriptional regulator